MTNKKVDVIIPTYKPDFKFEELVKRLQKQTYEINRIIVINTETGVFPEFVKQYDNVIVKNISPDEFDHGATRDMGAKLSDAEILVYMTQDAIPYNLYVIENLVKSFEDASVGAAYARQLPNEECDVIEKYTRSFNYPEEGKVKSKADLDTLGIKTFFCSNVCAAYRKDIYEELAGFVHKAIFNEDMILAGKMIQSGYSIAYVADSKVIHSHNYSCMQQFYRNFDVAVSQIDYPEVFSGIRSEDEGIRLVKKTALYLLKIHKPWLIISLVIKSGFKFIGFKMGQNYKKLPQQVVLKCTMNPRYWEKH